VVDASVRVFDVVPACCIAREFIVSTVECYGATDMARIDETSERAAAGERGALDDAFFSTKLLAYSHSDVPISFILPSCDFSFKENRAAMVFVDARVNACGCARTTCSLRAAAASIEDAKEGEKMLRFFLLGAAQPSACSLFFFSSHCPFAVLSY